MDDASNSMPTSEILDRSQALEDVRRAADRLRSAERAESRTRQMLARIAKEHPGLGPRALAARVSASDSIERVGVTEAGLIVVRPSWVAQLDDRALRFVLLHELLHLYRHLHRRATLAARTPLNIGHDAVVNDFLSTTLGEPVPAQGIQMPGARARSAEALSHSYLAAPAWGDLLDAPPPREGSLGLDGALVPGAGRDGSGACALLLGRGGASVRLDYDEYASAEILRHARSELPDEFPAIQVDGIFDPAEDAVVPRWGDAIMRGGESPWIARRTWSRSSRRSPGVRPGRHRDASTLSVLLDTSASMGLFLRRFVGELRRFFDAHALDCVHLVECDTAVLRARDLVLEDLDALHLRGSDAPELMVRRTPCEGCGDLHAWLVGDAPPTRLDRGFAWLESLGVECALVVTDERSLAPARPPRFDVLWVVPVGQEAPATYGRRLSGLGR